MKQTEGGFYFSALQAPVLFVLRAVYMGGGMRRLSFKRDLEVEDTDTAADEVSSVNEDDEDAFQEDEVEEEAVRLNNEWLALFHHHSDTEDEYFEAFRCLN